ncbi:MAG TPA: hypothetical protein VFB63_08655 [Bryobacteraceae bacterium]|nr:hypothetical protein [Bryobacteraceae bacterium]
MTPVSAGLLLLLTVFLLRAAAPLSDRAVAECVLRAGGSVIVEGSPRRYWNVGDLPRPDFRLHTVNLVGVLMDPGEFEKLRGLAHLRELYMSGRFGITFPRGSAKGRSGL